MAARIKVGLCGFSMAIGRYPEHFGVVEIQHTFYKPPRDFVMERWKRQVPADFEFTLKAWQLITHASTSATYRRLRTPLTEEERAGAGRFQHSPIVERAWQKTLHCTRLLAATAILFQCPASFRPTEENVANLRAFFRRIERPKGVRLLWEPRGEWPEALLRTLCRELSLVHVVDPFVNRTVTKGLTYFRLHGITGSRHVYSAAELKALAAMLPSRGEAYVMFNNIPRVDDARRFQRLLARPASKPRA